MVWLASFVLFSPLFYRYAVLSDPIFLFPVILSLAYTTLVSILVILLGRLLWVLLLPLSIVAIFHMSYLSFMGVEVSPNIIGSVFETHVSEVSGLINSDAAWKFISVTVVLLVLVLLPLSKRVYSDFTAKKKLLLSLGFLPLILCVFYINNVYAIVNFYPVREAIWYRQYFSQIFTIVQSYNNVPLENYAENDNNEEKIKVVLVLGEAARKASMGVYGYKRNTTPHLKEILDTGSGFLYKDCISASSFTRVSVASLLSLAPTHEYDEIARMPTIIRVARGSNVSVNVVSNNKRSHRKGSLSTFLLSEANNIFVKDYGYRYDESVVKFVQPFVENGNKELIIVDLAGSHMRYSDKYPDQWKHFAADEGVNEYDNTILYTDFVLDELRQLINASDTPIVMLYTSDHGENLNDYGDGNLGHGGKDFTPFELNVPCMVMFNDSFSKERSDVISRMKLQVDSPVSHDNISHTVLGLLNLRNGRFYKGEYDLSSPKFKQMPRYVSDRYLDIQDYKKVKHSFNKNKQLTH